MTRTEKARQALADNKALIISARRSGNDDFAKVLSQERNKIKKRILPQCSICGVVISRQNKTGKCRLHARLYKNQLPPIPEETVAVIAVDQDGVSTAKQRIPRSTPTIVSLRQRQLAILLAKGLTMKESAAEMGVSVKTAWVYQQRLLDSLNITGIAGITHYAIQNNLVQLGACV